MKSTFGLAVVTSGPVTLETAIAYAAVFGGGGALRTNRRFDSFGAAAAVIRADIEVGQSAVK